MERMDHPEGNYRFLATTTAAPFSAGVAAAAGYEIVHAVLRRPLPFREGFDLVARHLSSQGRPRAALCAVELRGSAPYTPEQWTAPDGFNERYRSLLREWGLFVNGFCPVARTNVVPIVRPPAEQVLHAFSYTIPVAPSTGSGPADAPPTFVASGAPEAQSMWASPAPTPERLLSSLDAVGSAIVALGLSWDDATVLDVYCPDGITAALAQATLERVGQAARHGLHWFFSRTPLLGPFLELDARGVRRELQVAT